jgi:very-short-patch-repair endonuclease
MDTLPKTFLRARVLRKAMSKPEVVLWKALRCRRLCGLAFRRQHPIGPYILDFYCSTARIAVEVDGFFHATDAAEIYDVRRDAWLKRQGIVTLRVPARLVMTDLDAVGAAILDAASSSPGLLGPSGEVPGEAGGGVS